MVRRRARDRLPELVDAAVAVFTARGFRAAQMSDIAAAMGVSEGALYRYVQSKDGLFRLVVRARLLGDDFAEEPLPLASPSLDTTLTEIRDRLGGGVSFPALDRAARRRASDDPHAELDTVLRELFALLATTRDVMDMIERSAREVPELATFVDVELRHPLLETLGGYVTRRIRDNSFRTGLEPAVAARFVLETVNWFARHRHGDPDGASLDAVAAESTAVALVVHALVPDRRPE